MIGALFLRALWSIKSNGSLSDDFIALIGGITNFE